MIDLTVFYAYSIIYNFDFQILAGFLEFYFYFTTVIGVFESVGKQIGNNFVELSMVNPCNQIVTFMLDTKRDVSLIGRVCKCYL